MILCRPAQDTGDGETAAGEPTLLDDFAFWNQKTTTTTKTTKAACPKRNEEIFYSSPNRAQPQAALNVDIAV